jgi:hypothetical protein
MSQDYSALLSPYEPLIISERHRTLTQHTLDLFARYSSAADLKDRVASAFLSSTFEVFCAPPAATIEESILSIKFLLVFFIADDAPTGVLDAFIADMERPGRDASGALARCYQDLTQDFNAARCDTDRFSTALRIMCISMLKEKRADKTVMTEDEFRQLRKNSVGVPSYTECWRTIRGLAPSPSLDAALLESNLLDIACELAYISNDIGSLERDEARALIDPMGVDPNLVLLRARALGNRTEALDQLIELHNTRVAEFQERERRLLGSEHGMDPALLGYLDILRATVNGNLATTRHLVPMRYEGALSRTARLLAV